MTTREIAEAVGAFVASRGGILGALRAWGVEFHSSQLPADPAAEPIETSEQEDFESVAEKETLYGVNAELDHLTTVPLEFRPDVRRYFRFVGGWDGNTYYLWWNDFPDEPMYTLVTPDGTAYDFNDRPEPWKIGPYDWPKSAERD